MKEEVWKTPWHSRKAAHKLSTSLMSATVPVNRRRPVFASINPSNAAVIKINNTTPPSTTPTSRRRRHEKGELSEEEKLVRTLIGDGDSDRVASGEKAIDDGGAQIGSATGHTDKLFHLLFPPTHFIKSPPQRPIFVFLYHTWAWRGLEVGKRLVMEDV